MGKNIKIIISKIKNLSLETINKNLLFIALLSLLFRIGNFATSYIPKPFEIIFTLVVLLTIIDLIKNNKIKEFFFSIPKNITIALFSIVIPVLIGWVFATFFLKIPFYFNMILEFGTFIISISIFLLIVFYTRNDKTYIKRYFYTLLIPIVYVFLIIFPDVAVYFNLADIHFFGFTGNPNIISKILIIPTIFLITKTLFEDKNKLLKITYFMISSLLVALLFWTVSRGAILSLLLGAVFSWIIFSRNNFNWKKLFYSGAIILSIFLIGFLVTPKSGKDMIMNRILHYTNNQYLYSKIKNMPEDTVKLSIKPVTLVALEENTSVADTEQTREPRFQIWSFYLNKVLMNPVGFGPNTHMQSYILRKEGGYDNTGPHNTYIQIWLWGGIVGLLGFIYLLINAFKNLKAKLKSDFTYMTVAITAILFALLVSITFDDSLSFYWFWIILAFSFLL
jgi:O-antigen ligase